MSDSEAQRQQQVVCVMGMSRTGTSVTARALNALGMYLGPERALLEGRQANPKGHWEHLEIMRLNQSILATLGGSWHEPPTLPSGWEDDPALELLRDRAREIIRETFARAPLWGWKDPRNCLTLPFWQKVVPGLRYVICIRNPLDVAASLERREEMVADKAFGLWLAYVAASIVNTTGAPRSFVFFEDFFEDSHRAIAQLAGFLGRAERARDPEVERVVDDWLEGGLWHHRSSISVALEAASVPLELKSLYLTLEVGVRGPQGDGEGPARSVDQTLDAYARQLVDTRIWSRPDALHASL